MLLRFPRLAVVSPSKSASQREEHSQKLQREERQGEKERRKPALSCDYGSAGDYSEFVWGGFIISPPLLLGLRGSPERRYSPSTFPVGIQHSQRNPELCWAAASTLQVLSPAHHSDMMSGFIEARLDFLKKFSKCGSHDL